MGAAREAAVSATSFETLKVGGQAYEILGLPAAARRLGVPDLARLPFSLRVLAENLLRNAARSGVDASVVAEMARGRRGMEVPFYPARVLLQDMLGVPALVDLAGLRDAVADAGGDPLAVNPVIPVDFVIDHSLIADVAGVPDAARRNTELEFARNRERFAFLAWCQQAFRNFRVVPPDSGIVHQINFERLARVVWSEVSGGRTLAYPDTLVCNDSHTPMINGIGVLGWGVGGIEAEAAMLGRSLPLAVPEVVGVRVTGALPAGASATDLVLTITEQLRRHGVVGKFVEFFGDGLDTLPVSERATVANMAPEYGATCVYFPIDRRCVDYLAFSGRDAATVALAEAYARAQSLWRDAATPQPAYDAELTVDLSRVVRCIAGPRRPQDRVPLEQAAAKFRDELPALARDARPAPGKRVPLADGQGTLGDGDVVIAAITSCTNTSNPANMIAAGLLARNAVARGLASKPWVKTSLAPGSRVVMGYLERAGLVEPLAALGFHLVGFGCTTCNGNSGPLAPPIEAAVKSAELVSVAVLSGNRNFEGRVHPHARAAYLASPALVVAYALAGTITRDLTAEPLGTDRKGAPVYLHELWPDATEVERLAAAHVTSGLYSESYAQLFEGTAEWRSLAGATGARFPWDPASTFLRRPPFFDGATLPPAPVADLTGLRPLAILGDSVSTDHLAPAGGIAPDSPAGRWLLDHGCARGDLLNYGIRRGNHEIAMRATLASPRLRNAMVAGTEGNYTRVHPQGEVMSIFDAAEAYRARGVPLVVIAGREYGAGSSRDWAAKGPALVGVRVVVAETFERIHRSNLVGMGVLPLELPAGMRKDDLRLDGTETFEVCGLAGSTLVRTTLVLVVHRLDGSQQRVDVTCRIDTAEEAAVYRHGGLLPLVFRELTKGRAAAA